jgi:hypothetical protein
MRHHEVGSSPSKLTPSPIRPSGSERRRLFYEGDNFDGESDFGLPSNNKYSAKRSLYEIRFKSLEDTIRKITKKLETDELLETMHQDKSSGEFVSLRIREIIDDCLQDEREMLIDNLTRRCNSLRREQQASDELYAQVLS